MARPRKLLVALIAACGVGLLGASVQGIAAADEDLARAVERLDAQPTSGGKDCPKPPGRRALPREREATPAERERELQDL
jgi:hypothetical protein